MLRNFQSSWPTQAPGLFLVLVSFVFYVIGLMLGRWLKRRINVELGSDLAESLSETVVTRRSATETQLASAPANGDDLGTVSTKEGFLRRLRLFFQL
jgi:hypothetical protein